MREAWESRATVVCVRWRSRAKFRREVEAAPCRGNTEWCASTCGYMLVVRGVVVVRSPPPELVRRRTSIPVNYGILRLGIDCGSICSIL